MSERNHETSAVWHKVDVIKPGSMGNIVDLSTHDTLTFFTAKAECRCFGKRPYDVDPTRRLVLRRITPLACRPALSNRHRASLPTTLSSSYCESVREAWGWL